MAGSGWRGSSHSGPSGDGSEGSSTVMAPHPSRTILLLAAALMVIPTIWAMFDPPDPDVAILMESSPACIRRPYTFKVKQEDAQGRSCTDMVTVFSCWGRCDSNEIGDWRFPFKRSYHPICQHEDIQPKVFVLENCDPGTTPGTEIYLALEAQSCRCQLCRSNHAVCEGWQVERRVPSRRSHD